MPNFNNKTIVERKLAATAQLLREKVANAHPEALPFRIFLYLNFRLKYYPGQRNATAYAIKLR